MELVAVALTFVQTDAAFIRIMQVMASLAAALFAMTLLLTRDAAEGPSSCLPPAGSSARATEVWFLKYGVVWISCFGVIIGTGAYAWFEAIHFMVVCVGLALPLLLQPFLLPSLTLDQEKPLLERYSFKANLWILIFSFIGNYWYTHYFYTVLRASYTFKSWDINAVPIPMIFATHFYFTFYHALANMPLRWIRTTFASGISRTLVEAATVLSMSYLTAFMEALTIAGFNCYQFADRYMAWVYGSAFYGIYFVVSFPMFLRLSMQKGAPEGRVTRSKTGSGGVPHFTAFQAAVESLATGMAVLCLLDFVRIALGQEFRMAIARPCKLDASLTCAPYQGQFC